MSADLPDYYFRIRENGAAVFRVDTENRQRRIEMDQIAVVNVKNGTVKPHGDVELTKADQTRIEEWLADRSRFAWDGLRRQRLDRPYVRRDGKLEPSSWEEAFQVVADKIKGTDAGKIAAIAGDLADVEAMVALKDLMASVGSPNIDCRQLEL